jgi:antitoxin component of MazEF toxin-antitoxin module
MVNRIVPHGEGYALLLDRELVEQLHIDGETPVDVTVGDNALIVTPVDEKRRAALQESIEEMDRRYADVFRRLAE